MTPIDPGMHAAEHHPLSKACGEATAPTQGGPSSRHCSVVEREDALLGRRGPGSCRRGRQFVVQRHIRHRRLIRCRQVLHNTDTSAQSAKVLTPPCLHGLTQDSCLPLNSLQPE